MSVSRAQIQRAVNAAVERMKAARITGLPILVDEDGKIVDGHARVAAARRMADPPRLRMLRLKRRGEGPRG